MSRFLQSCLWAAPATMLCVGSAASGAADRSNRSVRFLNRLRPGQETRYNVIEQQVITTVRSGHRERLVWRRSGVWTQYFAAGDEDHAPRVAHQLVLSTAKLKEYQRDDVPVDPDPSQVRALLPSKACQFLIRSAGASAVPMVLPSGRGIEGILYRLALDHLSWPDAPVRIDEPFRDSLEWDGFRGERIRRVVKAERGKRGRQATLAIAIQGTFAKPSETRIRLESAGAMLQWDLSNQTLLGLVSEVLYTRKRGMTRQATSLRITVEREGGRRLNKAQRQTAREALIELANLIGLLRQGSSAKLVSGAESFRKRFRATAWIPMVDYLVEQAQSRDASAGPLPPEELVRALQSVTIQWQAAMRRNDHLREALAWKTFGELNRRNYRDLLKLAQSADVDTRSMAVFALGFGSAPADLVTLERSARHEHPRVRAWAAYALAIRGSGDVSLDLLRDLLADEDENVRARACQAVGACVPADSSEVKRFRERLIALLSDSSTAVRKRAAEALEDIGTPTDAAAVQQAMTREQDPGVLDALGRTLESLTQVPGLGEK